jgi:MFS family permease
MREEGVPPGPAGPLALSRAPLAAFAAMGLLWGTFAALVPDTKAMIGAGDGAYGTVLLCSAAGATMAMILAPRIAAVLGRHALPAGTAAMGAAFFLPGLAPDIWIFGVAMVLAGVTSGVVDVIMNARVSVIEAERGVHLMNLNHAAFSFAYAAGALATGAGRAAGLGPGTLLPAAALVAVALGVAAAEARGRVAPGRPAPPGSGRNWGAAPVLGGLVILIAFLAENATEVWSALHIERTLGGSPAEGSLGPALLGLTMGIGRLGGQAVAHRMAEVRLLKWAAAVSAAGALLAAVAATPGAAYLGFTVLGFGVSVVAPTAFAMVGRRAGAAGRARAISQAAVLGYLGFFVGPPVLGFLSEWQGLRAAFAIVALALLAVWPLVARLGRVPPAP